MSYYAQELDRLRREVEHLQGQLAGREGKVQQLEARIRELEEVITKLTRERDFFEKWNNIHLGENQYLWDRIHNNPYSNDFYNDN